MNCGRMHEGKFSWQTDSAKSVEIYGQSYSFTRSARTLTQFRFPDAMMFNSIYAVSFLVFLCFYAVHTTEWCEIR